MNDLQIKVSQDAIKSRPFLACPECFSTIFEILYSLKSLPRIMTGASLPVIVELKVYRCGVCGAIYDNPEKLTTNEKTIED